MPNIDQVVAAHRPTQPAEPAQAAHGGRPAEPAAAAPSRWQKEFTKSSLINVTNTETNTDKHGRPEGTLGNEKVTLTEPLRDQFGIFLYRYVERLGEMQRENRDSLHGIHHEFDRKIINELVDDKGAPSKEKIVAFLGDEKNWAITRVAMQQHAFRLYSAAGMMQVDSVRGSRVHLTEIDERRIRLGMDQGEINRLWFERAAPFLREDINQTAGRHRPGQPRVPRWQAALGFATIGIPTGVAELIHTRGDWRAALVAAAATGVAAPTIAWAADRLGRDGLIVDRRRCGEMFDAMRTDPEELAFMRELTGINLENYQFNAATNRVELIPLAQFEESKNPEELVVEAAQILYAVQEFDVTWRGESKSMDAMIEEFILAPSVNANEAHNVQQTGFKIDTRINRRFFGVGGVNPADRVGTIQRWYRSRAEFLAEEWHRKMVERGEEKQRDDTIASLETRVENFDTSIQERRDQHTNNKTLLLADGVAVTAEESAAETYANKVAARRQVIAEAQRTATATRDRVMARVTLPVGVGGALVTPQDAINRLIDARDANNNILIDGRLLMSTYQRMRHEEIALAAGTGVIFPTVPVGIGGGAPTPGQITLYTDQRNQAERDEQRIMTQRQAEYERAKAAIDQDVVRINALIAELEGVVRIPEPTFTAESTPTPEETKKAEKSVGQMPEAYAAITGWETTLVAVVGGAGGVGLTQANLQTETVQQLLERINQAHERDNNLGWPESQNSNPEARLRLVHAMAEARARVESPAVAHPGVDFDLLRFAAPCWEISEHELRTLSRDQIRQNMVTKNATMPIRYPGNPTAAPIGGVPGVSDERIDVAILTATERLNARVTALELMQEELKREAAWEDKASADPDLVEPKARFEIALELLRNRGEVIRNAGVMAAQPDVFFNFMDVVDPAAPEYTEAMGQTYTAAWGGLPQNYELGYLEILNSLFNYRKFADPEQRNEAFEQARELVPPEAVAIALSSHLGPGFAVNANIAPVFFATNNALTTPPQTVDWMEIQEALEDMIQHVVVQVEA